MLVMEAGSEVPPFDFEIQGRLFEATGSDIDGLSETHGHRVLRVIGKGDKPALVPLPPAASPPVKAWWSASRPMRRHPRPHPAAVSGDSCESCLRPQAG